MSEITIETDRGECVWRLTYDGDMTLHTVRVLNAMHEYIEKVYVRDEPVSPLYDALQDAFYNSLKGVRA